MVPLYVLDHEIFSRQLVMVGEMIHVLTISQADSILGIEHILDAYFVRPVYIPIVSFGLLPSPALKVPHNNMLLRVDLPFELAAHFEKVIFCRTNHIALLVHF
jgi:hypothetical protein